MIIFNFKPCEFICAIWICVAASAFPQGPSLYRELGGPDAAFPDDPSSYQEDASDPVSIDEEPFFPEELDLSYRATSAGRNVENIPEAPEPRADEDNSGSQEVSDHGHGSAHHQHGFSQGNGHGHGPSMTLLVMLDKGYSYSPSLYSPHGYDRYPAYGGFGHGQNKYPAYGGYRQGYNRYPAYGGYRPGRFATPLYHHRHNACFDYRPAGYGHSSYHAYSRFPNHSYGRAGPYSRSSVYGRQYWFLVYRDF